ncbi:MAG: sigma-70 family RNA polymerase sigma factor [Acidobacteriota bacterium]|nr:MAG: sigma-70 family RNA polymerase sigma factor [Acidobacteriota bacterium]
MGFSKSIALDDKKIGGSAISEPVRTERSLAEVAFVEKLKSGDPAAFEQLVNRYSSEIYGLLYRIMKDPEEAKDITQETFLRAYRAISKFRGEASVKTWLYRIAINQSRNRYRWWQRRKKDKTVSLDDSPSGIERPLSEVVPGNSLTPEQDALRREQGAMLESAIAELPEHFREAVVLCDVQGFAYEEIADILEINIGTVKSRISRGRRELRDKLKDI